jgi:adenylate cyclase
MADLPAPPGPAADAFRRALAAERLRSARLFCALRFVGVSAFFALALLMGVVIGRPGWANNWAIFTTYWAVAGALLWLARRSDIVARLASGAIPLLDMPAAFALQWTVLAHANDPGLIAGSSTGFFVLLIIAGMATLDGRQLVAAATVAATLELILLHRAGIDPSTGVMTALVMLMAAFGCTYVIRRSSQLVADVSSEQCRRERLGRYFSPRVAELLAATRDDVAVGESREVTVLFLDVRDFTALAERLDGPRVVALLNDLHRRMVDTLFAFGGTLDKYLGDGLMAYFGAPVAQPDHAERAVRCALAMAEELDRLNVERAAHADPPLHVGIGIHTGRVILGDIGAPQRREYTVIGDAVNVAARLQELTKAKGLPILVSAPTRERVGPNLLFEGIGAVEVRGRARPLDAYVPAGDGARSPVHASARSMG